MKDCTDCEQNGDDAAVCGTAADESAGSREPTAKPVDKRAEEKALRERLHVRDFRLVTLRAYKYLIGNLLAVLVGVLCIANAFAWHCTYRFSISEDEYVTVDQSVYRAIGAIDSFIEYYDYHNGYLAGAEELEVRYRQIYDSIRMKYTAESLREDAAVRERFKAELGDALAKINIMEYAMTTGGRGGVTNEEWEEWGLICVLAAMLVLLASAITSIVFLVFAFLNLARKRECPLAYFTVPLVLLTAGMTVLSAGMAQPGWLPILTFTVTLAATLTVGATNFVTRYAENRYAAVRYAVTGVGGLTAALLCGLSSVGKMWARGDGTVVFSAAIGFLVPFGILAMSFGFVLFVRSWAGLAGGDMRKKLRSPLIVLTVFALLAVAANITTWILLGEEPIGFNVPYLLAALLCIGLVGFYVSYSPTLRLPERPEHAA